MPICTISNFQGCPCSGSGVCSRAMGGKDEVVLVGTLTSKVGQDPKFVQAVYASHKCLGMKFKTSSTSKFRVLRSTDYALGEETCRTRTTKGHGGYAASSYFKHDPGEYSMFVAVGVFVSHNGVKTRLTMEDTQKIATTYSMQNEQLAKRGEIIYVCGRIDAALASSSDSSRQTWANVVNGKSTTFHGYSIECTASDTPLIGKHAAYWSRYEALSTTGKTAASARTIRDLAVKVHALIPPPVQYTAQKLATRIGRCLLDDYAPGYTGPKHTALEHTFKDTKREELLSRMAVRLNPTKLHPKGAWALPAPGIAQHPSVHHPPFISRDSGGGGGGSSSSAGAGGGGGAAAGAAPDIDDEEDDEDIPLCNFGVHELKTSENQLAHPTKNCPTCGQPVCTTCLVLWQEACASYQNADFGVAFDQPLKYTCPWCRADI